MWAVHGGAVIGGTAIRESAGITKLWMAGRIEVAGGWLGSRRTDFEPHGLEMGNILRRFFPKDGWVTELS